MLVPVVIDVASGNPDWQIFVMTMFMSFSVGGMFVLANRGTGDNLNLRQAFLMTTLAWAVLPAFAALPLAYSELGLSYTDAYFEAMSGLTTTGSTIITGLDNAPPGILIWRALLQWFGGIGIIVMAVAILPMLQVGGMQVFKAESFDTVEKILPKASQISGMVSGIYISLTALAMILYLIAGMSIFDAMAHAMTVIATGGFSTSDGSIGHFDSYLIDMITLLFMIIGSIPFVLILQLIRGRPLVFWRDEQVKGFLKLTALLCAGVTIWLIIWKDFNALEAFRYGSFNIISILTGTGYATTNYAQWGSFSATLFFMVMFIGGCAGSTSCGIKIFRFQVLIKSMKSWVNHIIQPNGVFVPTYNRRPIAEDVKSSVMAFLALFLGIFILLAIAISSTGEDWITSFSSAGTALANVGPGLGEKVGPAGNFGSLTDTAKWFMSLGMLVGRLEIFSVLVLFSPAFWRG